MFWYLTRDSHTFCLVGRCGVMPPGVDWSVRHCGMMCRASRFCFSNTLNEFRNGQVRNTNFFPFRHLGLRYTVINCITHSHTKCDTCKTHGYERHHQHHICHWSDWILKKYLPILADSIFKFSSAYYILFACIKLLFYIRLWKCSSASFFSVCFAVHLIVLLGLHFLLYFMSNSRGI